MPGVTDLGRCTFKPLTDSPAAMSVLTAWRLFPQLLQVPLGSVANQRPAVVSDAVAGDRSFGHSLIRLMPPRTKIGSKFHPMPCVKAPQEKLRLSVVEIP